MSHCARRSVVFWAACVLGGCTFDGSLGSHVPAMNEAPRAPDDQAASSDATAAVEHDAPSATPTDEPSAPAMDPPLVDEPLHPPAETIPDASTGDTPPPSHDAAAEPPPITEPDPPLDAAMPTAHPPAGCDTATDNPCLVCDQTSCCEPRRACLEIESCACNLHCEVADNPAECRGACADPGERYQPWLSCLAEHCSEHCVL